MADLNIANKIEQLPQTPRPETLTTKTPEKLPEIVVEKKETVIPEKNELTTAVSVSSTTAATDDYHLRREKEIDAFLSDGLSETFLAMSPVKQKIFKEEGEKTAKKINLLLDATKINLGKIVSLIRRWLSLISGVNRFFLDQEAKIKADRIIKIKNKL